MAMVPWQASLPMTFQYAVGVQATVDSYSVLVTFLIQFKISSQ